MSKLNHAKKLVKFGLHAASNPDDAKRIIKQVQVRRSLHKLRHNEYIDWFAAQELDATQLEAQRSIAKDFAYRPKLSIIVPLYNTPAQFLKDCIDSVLAQTYDNWELCLADDASPEAQVLEIITDYARQHQNIHFVRLKDNQHIVGASNEALKLASGEFISLLDHDDLLLPDALFEVVSALNKDPKLDLIYSDEDKVDEQGVHVEPFFKPDWSPDFLLSCNYITHFSTFRKSIIDKIGGFRFGTEGAQDWDLILRFTQNTTDIYHIPRIIYSWRKSPTSTASTAGSKPYAYINQKRVLRDALQRNTHQTSVFESVYLGFWRVRYAIKGNPLVSIIIPTKDSYEYITQCIDSIIEQTSYSNFEVVIVDTGSTDQEVLQFYKSKKIISNGYRVVNWTGKQFNFSSACNFGAKQAKGEYYLFLNNDTKIISSDWIESMLEHAQREEIGMVGCKLLFPTDNIQHAGVVLRAADIAVHPFYNLHPQIDIFTNIYISNIRNCLAVTAACSMVQKDKFKQVGGFDTALRVTYNDVDLNLRLIDAGYHNLYTPYAKVQHFESISVGKVSTSSRDGQELEAASQLMRNRWQKYLDRDPYYNDNFVATGQPYNLLHK